MTGGDIKFSNEEVRKSLIAPFKSNNLGFVLLPGMKPHHRPLLLLRVVKRAESKSVLPQATGKFYFLILASHQCLQNTYFSHIKRYKIHNQS